MPISSYLELVRAGDWGREPKRKPSGLVTGACTLCLMDEASSLPCPAKIARFTPRRAGRAEGVA